VTRLAADDRMALQDASRFHEVHSASDLPASIVALCVGDKARLANPGANWNATDVITDPTLPGKRLIWAAIGSDYYVVHYERGGIAHTFHVLVAKLTRSNATSKVVWSAVGGPFKDYAAFLDALRIEKLDDRWITAAEQSPASAFAQGITLPKSDAGTRTHSKARRNQRKIFHGFLTKCFGSAMCPRIAFIFLTNNKYATSKDYSLRAEALPRLFSFI
jgi:hypothetical protein